MEFSEDEDLAARAAKAADEMVGIVRRKMGAELDFSDESARIVERFAGNLHRTLPPESERTPDFMEEFRVFTDDIGCYIGEVLRRNHGAVWGYGVDGGDKFVAMRLADGRTLIWPLGRAQQRVLEGPKENLADYVAVFGKGGS